MKRPIAAAVCLAAVGVVGLTSSVLWAADDATGLTGPNVGVIRLRPAARPAWADVRKLGMIDIRSEFPLDARSADALNQLPPTRRSLEQMLALTIPDKPIEITLFRSRASFDRYVRAHVPQGAGRSALFVQGVDAGRVYAYYSGRMHVDVRHESTHALLHSALPYVPLWLDEGLAEYFEVAPAHRVAGHPSLAAVKRAMWFRWRPNLTRLEAISDLRDMGEDEYRESWAWVHCMLHGPPPVRQVLRDYLDEIARGGFPGAIEPRLRRVVGDPSLALRTHLRSIP